MKTKDPRPRACIMVSAQPTQDLPEEHMKRICHGTESRTSFDVHLDLGGLNRLEPFCIDPAALLITVNGRRWKILVSDLAKQFIGLGNS